MKQRLQGIVMGFLIASFIFGAVTAFAASTRTIEVSYGVNVVVDGVRQNFTDDMRPFTSGGRTFMPLRAVADALGLGVEWDGATSTAYLTSGSTVAQSSTQSTPAPIPTTTPSGQSAWDSVAEAWDDVVEAWNDVVGAITNPFNRNSDNPTNDSTVTPTPPIATPVPTLGSTPTPVATPEPTRPGSTFTLHRNNTGNTRYGN
jgi:hypothetical protein